MGKNDDKKGPYAINLEPTKSGFPDALNALKRMDLGGGQALDPESGQIIGAIERKSVAKEVITGDLKPTPSTTPMQKNPGTQSMTQ